MSLTGKVALVTGSSRSIGAALVKHLSVQGANVIVNYVNDVKSANALVEGINAAGKGKAVAIQGDAGSIVSSKALLEKTIAAFGRLDILVLNAGILGNKPLADIDEKFYDDHMNTNVKGPLFLVQAATQYLPTPGGRVIFFSSSLTASNTVMPMQLCYVASKGAVEQISRALSKDLGTKGITVNTVSPGPVDTPLFRAGKSQQLLDMMVAQNPNNRLGKPDDIAPVVTFLASPEAQWVNGQNIRVNGGFVVG